MPTPTLTLSSSPSPSSRGSRRSSSSPRGSPSGSPRSPCSGASWPPPCTCSKSTPPRARPPALPARPPAQPPCRRRGGARGGRHEASGSCVSRGSEEFLVTVCYLYPYDTGQTKLEADGDVDGVTGPLLRPRGQAWLLLLLGEHVRASVSSGESSLPTTVSTAERAERPSGQPAFVAHIQPTGAAMHSSILAASHS